MHPTIIEDVIDSLRQGFGDPGNSLLVGKQKIPLSAEHFQPIKGSSGSVMFIDGGNQEIIGAPHFSLQLLRIASVTYHGVLTSRTKKEFFIMITLKDKEGLVYTVKTFGSDESFRDVLIEEEKLQVGGQPVSIAAVGNVCRRISELRLAKELSDTSAIILDGSLEVHYPHEQEEMDELVKVVNAKGLFLGGLCKTSRVFTDTGYSAVSALGELAPSGPWMYYAGGTTAFVSLHALGKYIFRFDFLKGSDFLPIIEKLAGNATDPIFLGYPYGLVEVDQRARVTHKEVNYYRTLLLTKSGFQKNIEKHLRALDAHSLLDSK